MKYFLDTEFIEGFHKPLFGKSRHFIDLISIGIVAEDGREYYAISTEFKRNDADDWVKKNVIDKLEQRARSFYDSPRLRGNNRLYKNNSMIANDIHGFVAEGGASTVEFYGYYADYDWVLFCSLFGRMIDLPKGFPMYCIDLKQMLDEKAMKMTSKEATAIECPSCTHDMYDYLEKTTNGSYKIEVLKKHHPKYPKQTNEHNALADAKWIYELYKFLKKH